MVISIILTILLFGLGFVYSVKLSGFNPIDRYIVTIEIANIDMSSIFIFIFAFILIWTPILL